MPDASSLPANKKYNKKMVNIGSVVFGSLFVVVGFIAAYFTFFIAGQGESLVFRLLMAIAFFAMFCGVGGAMIWSSLKNADLQRDLEAVSQLL
ncbi:hypothetical protein CHH28_03600 [Bacterioplanes sanyensis]|uniref:Uncharacterized protein n=1 Tax=Bacterioplanes sanyensis TaxID=1249553 RepID=A0A222FH53_9GAMM|nr:hypothetical protein [Bacterioplanes sanyensis]ASP37814.1 hypothetical protein CHH28_03600 [Bacterioplanes sanyensis]